MPFLGNEHFIIRQFVVARIRNPILSERDTEDGDQVQRQYALTTLTYYEKELLEGFLNVKINMPEPNKEFQDNVNVTNLISLNDLPEILTTRKEELSNRLFERLVIEIHEDESMHVVFDERIETTMSEIKALRQQ